MNVCRVESIEEEVVESPRIVSGDLGGKEKDDAEMGLLVATFAALSRSRDAAAADRVAS